MQQTIFLCSLFNNEASFALFAAGIVNQIASISGYRFSFLVLQQDNRTKNQIMFWDRKLLAVSHITDQFFSRWFGKTILAEWEKQ